MIWTEDWTAALSNIVCCIYARVQLVPADPYGWLVIYSSEWDGLGFVACLQGGAPVAFILHALMHTKVKLRVLSWLIVVVAWALQQLRQYTKFEEEILAVLTDAKSVVVTLDTATHLCLCDHLVDF